ncbi:MAG TPA: HPP family protein [Xanthomonadaceae bacterium]|nr:HPP family protein [Xanthomonadaceae bacterium]
MTASPGVHAGAAARRRPVQALLAGIGAFIGIAVVGGLAHATALPWLLGSFGASCVLLFGYPDVPFARARNVIGGHVLAATVAVACLHLLGPGWIPMALAAGIAVVLMIASDTTHPPAGSNPLIVFLATPQPDWQFILMPTLIGALTLYLLARVYWRLLGKIR